MRFRLIPTLLILAAIGLSLRAGAVWDALSDPGGTPSTVGSAIAQDAEPVEPSLGDSGQEGTPLELDEGDVPIIDGAEDMHPTELRLANSLAQRRAALDERERELEQREAMLEVVEDRLTGRQRELESIRDEIARLIEQYDTAEDEESARLQRVYANMKPKRAAAIFNDMELETILSVIRGMSERKLAPILESMNPEKAIIVTQEIDSREPLPDFGE